MFDAGHVRSAHHQHNHNYLGFPDGIPTTELRALGRAQLDRYEKASVLHHTIVEVGGNAQDGFWAATEGGTRRWHGRALVLATGPTGTYPAG